MRAINRAMRAIRAIRAIRNQNPNKIKPLVGRSDLALAQGHTRIRPKENN